MDIKDTVRNGIEWLDSPDSGAPANWRDLINPKTLNVAATGNCVLGQVFREVAEQTGNVNGFGVIADSDVIEATGDPFFFRTHGFAFNGTTSGFTFDKLTLAWKQELGLAA